jgi:CRISPR-associated protein Csb1
VTLDFSKLDDEPRLLMQVDLQPVQGSRFQPTGFPDLGAATFERVRRNGDGQTERVDSLLVESAQSMANRLEAVCWDEAEHDLRAELKGLPYVRSTLPDGATTNSILEAHRLNSPYIVTSAEFEAIRQEIGFKKDQPFDRRKLAGALLKFDPCSLVHGVFLEKVGGVVRLPRIVSAFVEAEDVRVAAGGGVKFDRVQPETTGESTPYGKANEGYGNVPYHRDEYTAGSITAYFNVDLALLRGLGLGEPAERLLLALSLYKIRRFLRDGLRLRTACDLEPLDGGFRSKRPEGFELPDLDSLEKVLPGLIEENASSFAETRVTDVTYKKKGTEP